MIGDYQRPRLRLWPAALLIGLCIATALAVWPWTHMPPVSVSDCSTIYRTETVLLHATLHNRSGKMLYRTDVIAKTDGIHNGGGSESDYAFFNPISPYHGYVDSATINAVISGDTTDSRLGQVVSCQVTAVEFQDGSKWKLETSK
jgi:hypothetical protein